MNWDTEFYAPEHADEMYLHTAEEYFCGDAIKREAKA